MIRDKQTVELEEAIRIAERVMEEAEEQLRRELRREAERLSRLGKAKHDYH